ncbi:hypothetical protein, partial [Shigella sonnei]
GTADRNRSHWSTSKTPSYTKSVSWQHHQMPEHSMVQFHDKWHSFGSVKRENQIKFDCGLAQGR